MGKSVFLILYLWHSVTAMHYSRGGPAISITPMPNLNVCEIVGKSAKEVFDRCSVHSSYTDNNDFWATQYKCVEVSK